MFYLVSAQNENANANGDRSIVDIYALHGISDVQILNNNNHSVHDVTLFCDEEYSSNCSISVTTQQCQNTNNICNKHVIQNETITTGQGGFDPVNDQDRATNNDNTSMENAFTECYDMVSEWIRGDIINVIICILTIILCLCSIICCCLCCDGLCCYEKSKQRLKRKQRLARKERINRIREPEGNVADAGSDDDSEISEFEYHIQR